MSAANEPTVKAVQKNDDSNWYYVITANGVDGPKVGPYDTEEEAIADGQENWPATILPERLCPN